MIKINQNLGRSKIYWVKWGQLYFSKQKNRTFRRTQGKKLIDPEKKSKISNGARKPRKNP